MKKNILLSVLLACTSMSIGAQSLNDSSSPSVNKAHSNVEHPVNLFATNGQSTNNSASSNVADNGVSIIEAKGWLERSRFLSCLYQRRTIYGLHAY